MGMHDEMSRYIDAQAKFLAAWKRGVSLAGDQYFHVKTPTVVEAVDKNQLRPDWDFICEVIGGLSHGERMFLAAMYSFFNALDGHRLFEQIGETGNICEIAAILDPERAQVIADLFLSYRGW